MIKIEIKYSIKIIENRNKIHYFVSGIEIFNFYFNFVEIFLSLYPKSVIIIGSTLLILYFNCIINLKHIYIYKQNKLQIK